MWDVDDLTNAPIPLFWPDFGLADGLPVTLQGLGCAAWRPTVASSAPPGGRLAQLVRALP